MPRAADVGTRSIYFQSANAPAAVAACLTERLPDVRVARTTAGTDFLVGKHAWLISTAATHDGGTLLSGYRGKGGDAIEPVVRFAVSRCALNG